MTARSAALKLYDREHAHVLARYRALEKAAPGSGDLWISTRTVILQRAREAEEAPQTASPQVRVGSGSGPGVELHRGVSNARTASGDPLHAHVPARARARGAGLLSRLGGGES